MENAYIESPGEAGFREECLKENWIADLADARERIEACRLDDNWVRPHSPEGSGPQEFAASRSFGTARPASPPGPAVSPNTAGPRATWQQPWSATLCLDY